MIGLLLIGACSASMWSSSASALTDDYGGGTYADGVNVYADAGMHTWNYNRDLSFSYSNNICAYISSGSDGSGVIFGSGCVPGSDYSFCHAPGVNTYYAFIEHLDDGPSLSLFGEAQTGASCPSGSVAAPITGVAAPKGLSVFKSDSTSADQAPASVRGIAATDNAAPHAPGVDVSQSRRVGLAPVYALPSANGSCAALVIPDGDSTAMACTDHAHEGLVTATTVTPDGYTVWGRRGTPLAT